MTGYVLTTAAKSDLRGIVRYTRKQWGDAQGAPLHCYVRTGYRQPRRWPGCVQRHERAFSGPTDGAVRTSLRLLSTA
nr:type II toxin-antitoxin system RelE/ParE family toxin [Photorhabdus hainanensis]